MIGVDTLVFIQAPRRPRSRLGLLLKCRMFLQLPFIVNYGER